MELRHLKYFLVVAETGSMRVAAEQRLHTSQPSLSRQIRDLEEELGVDLFLRTARGVELTAAGAAFRTHAQFVLSQVDVAAAAARQAAQPEKQRFALGFLTGEEMNWLPRVLEVMRPEMFNVDLTISSSYSPDLADGVMRRRLDAAFIRAEPGYDLDYAPVGEESLVVLMPSDHPLTAKKEVHPSELMAYPFIGMAKKARILRAFIDGYLEREKVVLEPSQEVDNPAMAMSLISSTGGLALAPAFLQNLMPATVVSRPLPSDAPKIELVVGYSRTNTSPVLSLFLSRLTRLRLAALPSGAPHSRVS